MSSGSVTVHADSTVQVLAEEAVTMDMLDLAVSTRPLMEGNLLPASLMWGGCLGSFLWLRKACSDQGLCLHSELPHRPLIGIKGLELLLSELSTGCGE